LRREVAADGPHGVLDRRKIVDREAYEPEQIQDHFQGLPMRIGLRFVITAALAATVWAGALAPVGVAKVNGVLASTGQILVLLEKDANLDAVAERVRASGGRVIHAFPPSALIVASGDERLSGAGIRAVYWSEAEETVLESFDGVARRAASTWNHLLSLDASDVETRSVEGLQAALVGDAFVLPSREAVAASAQDSDPTPDIRQTSEFLIGRVAVGVVMPESDGSIDPSTEDWTAEERQAVMSEIAAALDWWATREPRANLSFVYDDNSGKPIQTSYEPINHAHTEEHLWIDEVMEKKGYTGSSYFEQVYAYNNALREAYDADWAFTVFVVDSSEDRDDLFTDGYFAYAYTGGPFTVLTYGNAGYGIANMDAVAAHEIGHLFYALDQHEGARKPCTLRAGYLDVENQNSDYGECATDLPSIMRAHIEPFGTGALDPYARGQVGWRDSDGDGILDPVDTTITLSTIDYVADTTRTNVYTFTAAVQEVPYPSPSHASVTINTLEDVHYRVDGGDWTAAQAADGAFDSYKETFRFTPDPLPTGQLDVEVRVVDSAGNVLTQTLATISAVDPVDQILNTTLTRAEPGDAHALAETRVYWGQAASEVSIVASTYYRIDEGPWRLATPDDGAFDDSAERFSLTVDVDDFGPGTHELQVYSVDGRGNVEPSPATDTFENGRSLSRALLPCIVRAP
jgi:hypothetical protein